MSYNTLSKRQIAAVAAMQDIVERELLRSLRNESVEREQLDLFYDFCDRRESKKRGEDISVMPKCGDCDCKTGGSL